MIFPSMDKLENWGSKYALVTLAAKRAKQLKAGAPYLVETDSRNPLTVALEEIAAGKITCDVADVDIVISTSLEPEVAQLLAMPLDTDDALEAAAEELAAENAAATALVDDELIEEEEEEAEEEDEWIAVLTDDTEEEEEPPIVVDDEGEPVEVEAPVEDIAVVPEDEIEAKPARRRRGKAKAEEVIEPIVDEIEDSDDEESDDD